MEKLVPANFINRHQPQQTDTRKLELKLIMVDTENMDISRCDKNQSLSTQLLPNGIHNKQIEYFRYINIPFEDRGTESVGQNTLLFDQKRLRYCTRRRRYLIRYLEY